VKVWKPRGHKERPCVLYGPKDSSLEPNNRGSVYLETSQTSNGPKDGLSKNVGSPLPIEAGSMRNIMIFESGPLRLEWVEKIGLVGFEEKWIKHPQKN
jgi:hypothetical protein